MALPELAPLTRRYICVHMTDLSTASSAFVAAPFRGRIVKLWSSIYAATTTANATVTVEINGTAVTGMTLTVTQSGSAAGDVDSTTPTGKSTTYFNEGDTLEIITNGSSDTTCAVTFVLVLEPE